MLTKNSTKMFAGFVKLISKNMSFIMKENLPYLWKRITSRNLPLFKKYEDYRLIEKDEIKNVTKEDISKATYKEKYLRPTPGFQVSSPPIVALAKKLGAFYLDKKEYAEKVFNFVRENVKISFGENIAMPYQDALTMLKSGKGICFEQATLTATLARAGGIPARCRIDYLKLPDNTINVINSKYNEKLEENPFFAGLYELFAFVGGIHAGVEFYIDGKWISGEPALENEIQVALGNPIAKLGEEADKIGMSDDSITLMRYDSVNSFIKLLKLAIAIPMQLFLPILEKNDELLDELREEGKKILNDIGGIEKYNEMIKSYSINVPSIEEVKEFRNKVLLAE